ncbi:MAG: hypothetical protein VR68_09495 [Peptococcaceae bacterium BRH_c4a]|nr:MAG: hypothetical protein VR68_09495 [Peptococcaceae bacterium BRH_c4a]
MGYGKLKLSYVAPLFFLVFLITALPCRASSEVSVIPKTIKVGLVQDAQTQDFSVRGRYRLVNRLTGGAVSDVLPGERWQAKYSGTGLQLYKNGQLAVNAGSTLGLQQVSQMVAVLGGRGNLKNIAASDNLQVLGAGGKVFGLRMDSGNIKVLSGSGTYGLQGNKDLNLVALSVAGRPQNYRGDMEFRLQPGGITIINELPLEEYIYGVLPREMPASWLPEAQKAQAVSSRSYAVAHLGTYRNQGFDLLATQMSQVYGGYDAEHPNATRAVNETGGQLVLCEGKPISAFFHSSSGGYIEDARDVWAESLDYIKAKSDPYDKNENHYNWSVSYSKEQLVSQLTGRKGYYNRAGEPEKIFTRVDDIEILEKTSTGARVKKVRITGLDAEKKPLRLEISNADAVRIVFGLKSSLFTMKKESAPDGKLNSVIFTGSGFGHGLGMSQYGALGMARKGYNYQEILKYYYSNSEIGPLSGR